MSDTIDPNTLEYLVYHPDLFTEQIRTINGEDFSLEERPYLREIYQQYLPSRARTVILKCSRKVEKTETIINLILNSSLMIPYWRVVYTIARDKQINVFSTERLDTAIKTSKGGIIRKHLEDAKSSVSHKMFITDKDRTWYNHLYMYSAWGEAAALLGLATDFVIVDEGQDMPGQWFPMVREIFSLSKHKWMMVAGTARDEGDEFDKLWKMSSMKEWKVTCGNCEHEQFLTFEDNILGKKGRKYKGCSQCKKVIDVKQGRWVTTCDHEEEKDFVGYHMHQIMHPEISANELQLKYEKYTEISPRKFYNEVMGESYKGGSRPISIQDVLDCTNKKLGYVFDSNEEGNVMGADFNKGHHVMIMSKEKRILHQEVIDTTKYKTQNEIINHFQSLWTRYNCEKGVFDWGYSHAEVKDLQSVYGELARSCRYGNSDIDNWIKYKEYDDRGNPIFRLNVNRSRAIEMAISAIINKKIEIPYNENYRDFAQSTFNHYTNLTSNVMDIIENKKERSNNPYQRYGSAGPDHFFHALVYCLIALLEDEACSFGVWIVN